jgi:aryl sulfotransferase
MQARADQLVPDPAGILKDSSRFFRRGCSGAGPEVLSAEELTHYYDRVAKMAGADMLAWLHH